MKEHGIIVGCLSSLHCQIITNLNMNSPVSEHPEHPSTPLIEQLGEDQDIYIGGEDDPDDDEWTTSGA